MIILQLLNLLPAVYRNGKNRCDRRGGQWTGRFLDPKEVQDQAIELARHPPQYDEPETKALYDFILTS